MSRLTDLLAQARKTDPQLAADLEAEFRQLTQRSQFGLVFERHQPEAVELPGRPVRRGDTVRVLPPRGSLTIGDTRHWVVTDLERTPDGKQAHLTEADVDPEVREPATSTAALEDLVVVARFEDPIYPGLVETGRVENGGDKPFHTVINAENFHALEMLTYTHRHKVDCIYIDPPYNTGAKDWKYNNDYVGKEDDYYHSKWLSFMQSRLEVARDLLNPSDSTLIVTIDEKEYARLALLLEKIFPGAKMQMVSSVINPRGIVRGNEFARSNEFIYYLRLGAARIAPESIENSSGSPVAWETMRRRSIAGARGRRGAGACGPNQFFAIHVDVASGAIVGRGEPLPLTAQVADYRAPRGCVAVFPARDDGTEMNWSLTHTAFDERWSKGYVRAGKATPDKPQKYIIQYILGGVIDDIESGRVNILGRNPDGSIKAEYLESKERMAHSQWNIPSHNAQQHGTGLLEDLMPKRKFPYAKSLYAVEDALRFVVASKPNALILDFFSGSGTTAHAVMRLNKQDGGRRQCISVTNNEVSADEQKGLRKKGLRPGDAEWEQWGICDYVTKPRVTAAITGRTPAGDPIKGEYKFTDEFPMADGFEENAAFFTLTYEAPRQVRRNRAFARVAPMLWLKAGSRGRIISSLPERGWDVAQAYGVLEDMDHAPEFLAALEADPQVGMAFIVTDSEVAFQSVARQLPEHATAVRLYESYLHNFQINRRA
ncbi:site-specific DNA-methyltransferase [Micrococcus sp. NPDC055215]